MRPIVFMSTQGACVLPLVLQNLPSSRTSPSASFKSPTSTSYHHHPLSSTSMSSRATNSMATVEMAGCRLRFTPSIQSTMEGYREVWECCKCKEVMETPRRESVSEWYPYLVNEVPKENEKTEEWLQMESQMKRKRLGACRACNHGACYDCWETVLRKATMCWSCEMKQVRKSFFLSH